MKLYYVPMTRALRPRWVLEELGVPYELVRLDPRAGDNKKPEYLAIHPLGHVPALVDGELKLFESAALCMYLADKYPDKGLAPAPGTPERGEYYQWIVYAMTTMEPPLVTFDQHTARLPPDSRVPALADQARSRLQDVARVLRDRLAGKEFLVGGRFTAADVVVGAVCSWANRLGLLDAFPELVDYAKRMMGRPAAKRARDA